MKEVKTKEAAAGKKNEMKTGGDETGSVKINENVFLTLVRKAALSVNGVTRLAGSTLVDSIAEIIGNRRMHDRAITVVTENDTVKIDVRVNLAYGARVPDVASEIQSKVIQEIKTLTGAEVSEVNVIIEDLEDLSDESEKEDNS